MSVVENQGHVLLQLLAALQPHWRSDRALPERITRVLSKDRRFGSRDRRLYRELIYTVLRYLPWIEPLLAQDPPHAIALTAWLATETRDTREFRKTWTRGWSECPTAPTERARLLGLSAVDLLPAWFRTECPAALAETELAALHRRAALWIRWQTDTPEAAREDFYTHGWTCEPSPMLAGVGKLPADAGVTACASYFAGAFEVQDLGSQMVLAAHAISPGTRWLDACAGAGGKTLQLARIIGPDGLVLASDIRANALDELTARVRRSGRRNITVAVGSVKEVFDGVLVDAPCSGSGTWRRAPHLKWSTTASSVRAQTVVQQKILAEHAVLVRPGGRLIYATCSLNHSENDAVVAEFLRTQPDFEPVPPVKDFGFTPSTYGLTILPARHDTDGFFTCSMRRN